MLRRGAWLVAVSLGLAACAGTDGPDATATATAAGVDDLPVGELSAPADAGWASTAAVDGNHHVAVPAGTTDGEPGRVDIDVDVDAQWLVSVELADGRVLHVVTDGDAAVAAAIVGTDAVRVDPSALGKVPSGRPALRVVDGAWAWLDGETNGEPPVPLGDGRFGRVDRDGNVHLGQAVAGTDALPDARLAVSSDGRVAWLAAPTGRYGHGVIGDELEARTLVIADAATAEVVETVRMDPAVVEGTGVIWGDLDGDGRDDVLYTRSRQGDGAGLQVRLADGRTVSGEPIGASNRWRHQVAIAPGPDGVAEVVEVVTPHLARIATWSQVVDGALVGVHEVERSVASHAIGSRNLDAAVAADLTGDGVADLVGPAPDGSGLVVVDRLGPTTVLGGGTVATNVTVTLTDEGVQLAAATTDGTLHVWTWPASG